MNTNKYTSIQLTRVDIKTNKKDEINSPEKRSVDCQDLLDKYGVPYTEDERYLQIGEIPSVEGWGIYISVIRIQFMPLLKKLLPELIEAKVSFKIPRNKNTAKAILEGWLGKMQLGKLICIYPQKGNQLLELAKILISLTAEFRGPAIPTARALGGCVYAQYNTLTKNNPEEVKWPFEEIVPATLPASKPLWNFKYKPLAVIKPDFKGRVIQANYFKSLFNIKLCIIKEGIKNMWADDLGRDITDRLKWQYELYKDLSGYISTPEIFDIFEEQNNTYLTMEYIKGDSLGHNVESIYKDNNWFQLSVAQRLTLLNYVLKIISLIEKLHEKGYVHRDITPANFIINKKGQIFLIDMELTYSIVNQKPDPPFKHGTPGYMSQEQALRQKPTIKEDIYALGALMIYSFTGLSPVKFETQPIDNLFGCLSYFSEDAALLNIIRKCLDNDPEGRPDTLIINETLKAYQEKLTTSVALKKHKRISQSPDPEEIKTVINRAILTLCSPLAMSANGIWDSLKEQDDLVGMQSEERISQPGFYKGISGILFLLARASRYGYNIESCTKIYTKNWQYLKAHYLDTITNTGSGLFYGQAGIALAINEGIRSGLLMDHDDLLQNCFPLYQAADLNLANGIAGQGIALLRCKANLNQEFYQYRLKHIVDVLLRSQQKDGSWYNSSKKNDNIIGLVHGTAGILCFLITYARSYKDEKVLNSIQKGLHWLLRASKKDKDGYRWAVSTRNKTVNNSSCAIGIPGVVLTFIKAFELLQDPIFRTTAENALYLLPEQPISIDFSQIHGLAGLGEVYLDAYRVFGSGEWEERINWITGVFTHTLLTDTKALGYYWSMSLSPNFDGDLMTGSSGVLHFLMRTLTPANDIGHLLICNE